MMKKRFNEERWNIGEAALSIMVTSDEELITRILSCIIRDWSRHCYFN